MLFWVENLKEKLIWDFDLKKIRLRRAGYFRTWLLTIENYAVSSSHVLDRGVFNRVSYVLLYRRDFVKKNNNWEYFVEKSY